MNTKEIIELSEYFITEMGPQLRSFAYADWFGWLLTIIFVGFLAAASWVCYKNIKDDFCEASSGIMFVAGVVSTAFFIILLICFIPYTVQVFANPELSGLKNLLP